ncbi:MAG: ThiF family adenylyltransferase [Archaeoglobaceae archaeon]|nr:ThiF family adenylyltransferase [Archaeoglobaceae archaeon]
MALFEVGSRRIDKLGRGKENINKSVVVAGVGNLGSKIAHNLAKQSFGKIILIDFDTVEKENVGYQEYGVQEIGLPKVEALKMQLEKTYPWVRVEDHKLYVVGLGSPVLTDEEILNQDLILRNLIQNSDCLAVSFDSIWPRLTMLAYSIIYRKPIVFASAWSNKLSDGILSHHGRLNIWKPGFPCLLCYTFVRSSGAGTYVAHPTISGMTSNLCSFFVEAILWDLPVKPYVTIEFSERKNEIKIEHFTGKMAENCICSKSEELRKTLEEKGFMELIKILEEAVSR